MKGNRDLRRPFGKSDETQDRVEGESRGPQQDGRKHKGPTVEVTLEGPVRTRGG